MRSVLCLRRDFPGVAVVPLNQLHEAARSLHAEAALGAALPAIRSQFESLEAELGGYLAELGPAAGGGPAAEVGAALHREIDRDSLSTHPKCGVSTRQASL